MRAQLVPLDGGPPIEIVKDLIVVGRKEDCDLRLEHKSVSKMHCVIVKTDGLLLLRDLGSTNGTRVNGQRVRRAALLPNDQVSIASFKFRVHLGPDEPPGPRRRAHAGARRRARWPTCSQRPRPQPALDDDRRRARPGPLQPNPLPDVYPDDEKS